MVRLVLMMFLAGQPVLAQQEDKTPRERIDAFRTAQAFDCRDVACSRLSSCAEACYKLIQCGQSKRDGDGDGIPCENLCSRRC